MDSQFDYKNYQGFMDDKADRSPLKDANGKKKTASLFLESASYQVRKNGHVPLYTLKDVDYAKYKDFDGGVHYLPSAYRIYINSVDETEAALKLVGSLSHWRVLIREHGPDSTTQSKWYCPWLMNGRDEKGYEGLLQWRLDMEARDRMYAKKALQKKIEEEGNVTAAKQFLDYGTSEHRKVQDKGQTHKPKGVNAPDTAEIDDDLRLLQKYKGAGNA